jgi:hypothetical protein
MDKYLAGSAKIAEGPPKKWKVNKGDKNGKF